MKKRSGFAVMARLIGLVKPLSGYMSLAVLMGSSSGRLSRAFITIFGGITVCWQPFGLKYLFSLTTVFIFRSCLRPSPGIFAVCGAGVLTRFIAFKLLALLRDRVFRALEESSAPAKLEGREQGGSDLGDHLRY